LGVKRNSIEGPTWVLLVSLHRSATSGARNRAPGQGDFPGVGHYTRVGLTGRTTPARGRGALSGVSALRSMAGQTSAMGGDQKVQVLSPVVNAGYWLG